MTRRGFKVSNLRVDGRCVKFYMGLCFNDDTEWIAEG